MPEIALIKGILYDPAKVKLDNVIAPPYDVISEPDRDKLEKLDPHNVVRLILPRGEGDEKYQAAGKLLQAWRDEGVLKRDMRPAIYRYHQLFKVAELGDRKLIRKGMICAARLHDYDEHVIMPHERTLRGPKEDRLKLMRAANAHFSQIFGLYRDPSHMTDRPFDNIEMRAPDLQGTTLDGTEHRLWRVNDRETIAQIARAMAPLKVYIADGHHRYETMLALRNEMRAANGGQLDNYAAAQFGTFFLANMSDPGLVVLPTHRLVHSLAAFDREALFTKAREHFRITQMPGGAKDVNALRLAIHDHIGRQATFGVVLPGSDDAWIFTLQSDPQLPIHKSLRLLDVSLLHGVLLEQILGIDREAQEAQRNITYVKDLNDAVERVQRGEAQIGFLMNPTRVDQVLEVADTGQVMPEKSTFFVPKIASGLVINPLVPGEDVEKAW